jgi:membrane-bound lytic murein transglycosylase
MGFMKLKNNILNRLLAIAFLLLILQAGCTTTEKKSTLSSTEAVKAPPSLSSIGSGTGLAEITDPNQFPEFRDEYGKIELLYAVDNSKEYFKKNKSYPESFKSMGFTPEKQIETLNLFRDGYVASKSPQELSEFIAKNFRVFKATGKQNGGTVQFAGYGLAVFGDDVERKWKHTVHYGSIGLPVTPMRSIAADDRAFPPGGLAFVLIEGATNLNEEEGQTGKAFFALTHDSRSTTKTDDRVEIFFGIGKDAILKSENFNTEGKLYYLLKK